MLQNLRDWDETKRHGNDAYCMDHLECGEHKLVVASRDLDFGLSLYFLLPIPQVLSWIIWDTFMGQEQGKTVTMIPWAYIYVLLALVKDHDPSTFA